MGHFSYSHLLLFSFRALSLLPLSSKVCYSLTFTTQPWEKVDITCTAVQGADVLAKWTWGINLHDLSLWEFFHWAKWEKNQALKRQTICPFVTLYVTQFIYLGRKNSVNIGVIQTYSAKNLGDQPKDWTTKPYSLPCLRRLPMSESHFTVGLHPTPYFQRWSKGFIKFTVTMSRNKCFTVR